MPCFHFTRSEWLSPVFDSSSIPPSWLQKENSAKTCYLLTCSSHYERPADVWSRKGTCCHNIPSALSASPWQGISLHLQRRSTAEARLSACSNRVIILTVCVCFSALGWVDRKSEIGFVSSSVQRWRLWRWFQRLTLHRVCIETCAGWSVIWLVLLAELGRSA